MPELTDVVKAALDAATATPEAETADADATPETDSGAESSAASNDGMPEATPAAEAQEAAPKADDAAAPAPPSDEMAREMEALGLKHVAGKDNRIPYNRVTKIIENARKKQAEEHAKVLAERVKEYEQAQQELQNFRAVDQLIQSDPERYLTLLSGYVPAYQRFIQPQQPAAPAPSEKMPEADVKFPDGSPGYSPEQQQKLFDWIGRQAEERAVKRLDSQYSQRLAPIEQRLKAEESLRQRQTQARQQVGELYETWGQELVDRNEKEILQYMEAHPKESFKVCARQVLMPKLQADRTRQREELLKELEARPKAAAPTPSAPTKTPTPTGPRSLEDVVREAIAPLRG